MAILLKKVNFKAKMKEKLSIYLKTRVKSLPNRPSFLFFEIKIKVAYAHQQKTKQYLSRQN